MSTVMQIVSLADGRPSPFDGEFLVEYDPDRDGQSPQGIPMVAHVVTTPDIADARHFTDAGEALNLWKQVSQRDPLRTDGRPNRPLTAFTVEIGRVEKFTSPEDELERETGQTRR